MNRITGMPLVKVNNLVKDIVVDMFKDKVITLSSEVQTMNSKLQISNSKVWSLKSQLQISNSEL